MVVRRFDVFLVSLDPTVGREIQKTRPAAVISPDEMNQHLSTFIIAPMTSQGIPYPTRVPCRFQEKQGQIVLDSEANDRPRSTGEEAGKDRSFHPAPSPCRPARDVFPVGAATAYWARTWTAGRWPDSRYASSFGWCEKPWRVLGCTRGARGNGAGEASTADPAGPAPGPVTRPRAP